MKESKVKIETQLKLLDIAEQEIENIIARNRISETETFKSYRKKTGNDARFWRSARIYGFQ